MCCRYLGRMLKDETISKYLADTHEGVFGELQSLVSLFHEESVHQMTGSVRAGAAPDIND